MIKELRNKWFWFRFNKIMCPLTRKICLYRPEYITGFNWQEEVPGIFPSGWWPVKELGPLRAKLFGIRVPIEWAFNWLIFNGTIKSPDSNPA